MHVHVCRFVHACGIQCMCTCVHVYGTDAIPPPPSPPPLPLPPPAARDALIPAIVRHLIMYMDSTLPKHLHKAGYVGNRDCFTCVGKVLETFSDPSLALGTRDVQSAVRLLQPFLKLHSLLEKQNDEQLSVSGRGHLGTS